MWSSSILATLSTSLGAPHNICLVKFKHYPISLSRLLLQAWARWDRSTARWRIPETITCVPMEKVRVWFAPSGVRPAAIQHTAHKYDQASLFNLSFLRSILISSLVQSCPSNPPTPQPLLATTSIQKSRTRTNTLRPLVHCKSTMLHTRTKRSIWRAMKHSSRANKSSTSWDGRNSPFASSSKPLLSER